MTDPGICERGGVACVTTISLVILAKLFANFCLIYFVVNNNLGLKLWVFCH